MQTCFIKTQTIFLSISFEKLVCDLNLNSLDYKTNNLVQNFSNFAFENCVFSMINRPPPRITKTSATAIDRMLPNTILHFEV